MQNLLKHSSVGVTTVGFVGAKAVCTSDVAWLAFTCVCVSTVTAANLSCSVCVCVWMLQKGGLEGKLKVKGHGSHLWVVTIWFFTSSS